MHGACEQDQPRILVLTSGLGKQLVPGIFGIGQHDRGESTDFVLDRPGRHRFDLRLRRTLEAAHQLEEGQGVHAGEIADREDEDDAADPQSPADARRAQTPPILDILTFTLALPAHVRLSLSSLIHDTARRGRSPGVR